MRFAASSIALALAACAGGPTALPRAADADLVLRGGRVFSGDEAGTIHRAIALRGERIVAVDDAAEQLASSRTRIVDLRGRLVTAGMNDAHCHFGPGGLSLLEVDLRGATTLAQIEERVKAAAQEAAPGEWILGRGWDQTRLAAAELGASGWPDLRVLDRASPDHPVYLMRVDGHVAWANTAALGRAGVVPWTPDPPGGRIVRNARGNLTGILQETAARLVARKVPPPTPQKRRRGILAALDLAARTGVTSVQTEASPADFEMYQALQREGLLTVRVYGWVPLTLEAVRSFVALGERAPFGDAWLRRGLLKEFADGTLGSRTALLLEPYSDEPTTRGLRRIAPEELDRLVVTADAAGLQVAIHAIGDAANRTALDAVQRARTKNGDSGIRHRIEHAQVLDAADVPRFARLGVVASMQPTHATSDLRWAEARLGKVRAAEGAYAWRKLIAAGAHLAFGTDFAVEPLAPVEGLYSAVTRRSREPPFGPDGGWIPSEKLTMAEAIRLYTVGSAYAEMQELEKGTLEPGKLADLVVWDTDLLAAAPEQVLGAKPDLTIVGGRIVYEAVR
jgi:predicted amidohydrolase YtcJ